MRRQRGFVPKDLREVRLWNYYNQDATLGWWPINVWPEWVAGLALKKHKSNRDRFSLFYFWTVNGMNPQVAFEHLLVTDVTQGRYTSSEGYDEAAHRQAAQLRNQALDGSLFNLNKRYFDMALGKVVSMWLRQAPRI